MISNVIIEEKLGCWKLSLTQTLFVLHYITEIKDYFTDWKLGSVYENMVLIKL